MKKIILSADSTCDLDEALKARYEVNIQPLYIILDDQQFRDGIDITPDQIYETYEKRRILPKTSAPSPSDYIQFFKKWTDEGHEVIHISLGSGLSSSYQNACIAAEELGNVYPVDSGNLSTGMAHLVIEAANRIAKGMEAKRIAEELSELKLKVHASFVINQLTYLYEGGRCSALQAIGASILNIKPCIEVDPSNGKMTVGKKYRGSLKKSLKRYTKDKLTEYENINPERIFITHSGTSEENIELVRQTIEETMEFKEIIVNRAGCTISSHCGPNTLGILFMTK